MPYIYVNTEDEDEEEGTMQRGGLILWCARREPFIGTYIYIYTHTKGRGLMPRGVVDHPTYWTGFCHFSLLLT